MRENALARAVFVDEDVVGGGVWGVGEDVVLEGSGKGEGEETGDYGVGEPGWERGREERIGRGQGGGVGLETPVGEVFPVREGGGVDLNMLVRAGRSRGWFRYFV